MKETSPKSNNGTILDINESFKIEFDPISDALAAIRNGECIIVVDIVYCNFFYIRIII